MEGNPATVGDVATAAAAVGDVAAVTEGVSNAASTTTSITAGGSVAVVTGVASAAAVYNKTAVPETLREVVDTWGEKLNNAIQEVNNVKDYDLFKFAIIAFVCTFFGFILIHNTFKTLNIYYKINNSELLVVKSNIAVNEYQAFESETKFENSITRSIKKSNKNQNNALKEAQTQIEMIVYDPNKTDMQLEDYELEADIHMNTIDNIHD